MGDHHYKNEIGKESNNDNNDNVYQHSLYHYNDNNILYNNEKGKGYKEKGYDDDNLYKEKGKGYNDDNSYNEKGKGYNDSINKEKGKGYTDNNNDKEKGKGYNEFLLEKSHVYEENKNLYDNYQLLDNHYNIYKDNMYHYHNSSNYHQLPSHQSYLNEPDQECELYSHSTSHHIESISQIKGLSNKNQSIPIQPLSEPITRIKELSIKNVLLKKEEQN